jgi:hypothetical protein
MEPDFTEIIRWALDNRAYCLETAAITPCSAVARMMLRFAHYWEKFAANVKRDQDTIVSSRRLLRDVNAALRT